MADHISQTIAVAGTHERLYRGAPQLTLRERIVLVAKTLDLDPLDVALEVLEERHVSE